MPRVELSGLSEHLPGNFVTWVTSCRNEPRLPDGVRLPQNTYYRCITRPLSLSSLLALLILSIFVLTQLAGIFTASLMHQLTPRVWILSLASPISRMALSTMMLLSSILIEL